MSPWGPAPRRATSGDVWAAGLGTPGLVSARQGRCRRKARRTVGVPFAVHAPRCTPSPGRGVALFVSLRNLLTTASVAMVTAPARHPHLSGSGAAGPGLRVCLLSLCPWGVWAPAGAGGVVAVLPEQAPPLSSHPWAVPRAGPAACVTPTQGSSCPSGTSGHLLQADVVHV